MERQKIPRADQVDFVLNALKVKTPLRGLGGYSSQHCQAYSNS